MQENPNTMIVETRNVLDNLSIEELEIRLEMDDPAPDENTW